MHTARNVTTAVLSALLICTSILAVGCGQQDAPESESQETEAAQPKAAGQDAPLENDIDADTVVAKVGDREILFSELQSKMEALILSLPQTPPPEVLQREIPALLQRVLDNIINLELLENAVASEGVTVSESDVVKRVRQTAASLPEGQRLSEMLEQQGSSLEEFQANLRRDLAIQKLLEKHTSGVDEPTSEQVESFYENNPEEFDVPAMASAHHILVPFRPEDDEQIRQQKLKEIEEIHKQIVAGADFEEMARRYSSGPSAQEGGDLGKFPRGQMLKAFDDAVFSQTIGTVGEPVETTYGYHIIRVDEREPARTVPLDEARANIEEHLKNKAKQDALAKYMQQLRANADIEILRDASKISVKFNPDSLQTDNG